MERIEGEVISFTPRHYGFLKGDDGEIFYFDAKEVHLPFKPVKGLRVEFSPIKTDKGMRATNIGRIFKKEKKNGKEGTGSYRDQGN